MKPFFLIILFLNYSSLSSQDTLVYRNATKALVTLKEVTPTEIKYLKFEMADGPLYIVNKNDIEKIIYKNGMAESFAVNTELLQTPKPQQSVYKSKITYADTKTDFYVLRNMSASHPDLKRQIELIKKARAIKRFKMNRGGALGGAIAFGAVAVGGIMVYSLATAFSNNSANELYIVPPIASAVLAVSITALTITFDLALRKKRKEYVNLYNE